MHAYQRYQQALARPWARESEDEIHKLFHSLVRGRGKPEDFKHYYNQLYRLAPEWLEAEIRPWKRLPSENTPKRIRMN
jgi:hypothetical protein